MVYVNLGNPANTVDTIVAISTPPGRGGIGIVRLSGPSAILLAEGLLQLRHSLRDPGSHARAWFAKVLDPAATQYIENAPQGALKTPQNKLDDALVTAFRAPHSYTGEDLVEIAAHGSPVILDAILRAALDLGDRLKLPVRLATAGEFTQRAFLNGRLDLTQAEAVHDLIAAQTIDQARVAAQQLGGALSRRVAPAKEQLLHLIAILEAGMDFASGELDDIEVVPREEIASAIQSVEAPLAELAASFHRGQLLRNGAAIALVGRPNAGKSSLFNRLLERERAIVTPVPGTTRDTLEEVLSLGGIPIRLIDTAGLRAATTDEVEALGMKRTEEALADADLILYIDDISIRNIDDTSNPGMQADPELPLKPNRDRPHMIVHNKCDLLPETYKNILIGRDSEVYTSALTGQGLEELRTMILGKLQSSGSLAESGLLNNHRQQQAILETLKALSAATAANSQGLPHELLLVDLHTALRALDSLTGATTSDDILARIFSTFCIGK